MPAQGKGPGSANCCNVELMVWKLVDETGARHNK